ncbi:hypothetical protein MPSEU_000859700 [Mayamaea pseudoterrestris]|nr:hypothetical protein MPSEU_000859700 [Mayamaea pseudoterrestris]
MPSSTTAVTRRRRVLETAIAAHFGGGDSSTTTTSQATPALTDSAVSSLVPCLEEFLRVLSNELATINPSSSEKMKQVSSQHVVAALENMGFGSLAAEANEIVQRIQPQKRQPEARAHKRRRKQEFSQELADAQEQLLAASKRKMEGD